MLPNTAQRLALNLDSHIVIDAGAGTGKTKTIIDRVIEHYLCGDQRATRILPVPERPPPLGGGMLISPSSETVNPEHHPGLLPGEVVLLTFTNKAADEMRHRLRDEISKLRMSSSSISDHSRGDPRVTHSGLPEQLLTLLEDAPIGTIDSFFNQLVSPYRGFLGDALSRENISDASRILLIEDALDTLWRLPSSVSGLGDAVDAGIPADIALEVLEARERIARRYSGRKTAARLLSGLVRKSVFIDEGLRRITDNNGRVDPLLLRERILSSTDSHRIESLCMRINEISQRYCDIVLGAPEMVAGGIPDESRMACLISLNQQIPSDTWEQLVWLASHLDCTASATTVQSDSPTIFPRQNIPDDNLWPRGVKSWSAIKDKHFKESTKQALNLEIERIREAWTDSNGLLTLHFAQIAMLLDPTPPPCSPPSRGKSLFPLPDIIPDRLPQGEKSERYYFTIEAEARNLDDLRLAHLGFKGILKRMKEREGVHDFDDIQALASDLLLSKCPEVCRKYYPTEVIRELDSIGDEPWRDDHIIRALHQMSLLEDNPNSAGETASNLSAIRLDLERRYELLRTIRRRFRAFIIDEAQDNSPLQWRLLSRLWGERSVLQGESPSPDTPWQPTICYVGDVKQSIYAFRQAEVVGFLEYARTLMAINQHEFASIPLLREKPPLRKLDSSRDPRNAHILGIKQATTLAHRSGIDATPWVPFDLPDRGRTPKANEVERRRNGLIRLDVNYRTKGGLLDAMNHWWDDVFSDIHRDFPDGDFYATPQPLRPCEDKADSSGSVEWICPILTGGDVDAPEDLTIPLDSFGFGKPDSIERQAMLIALRVRNLINGEPVRVLSSNGKWSELPAEEPTLPSDIMILLPSRSKLRDSIMRELSVVGVPAQADREGSLLQRPTAHALDGLLQLMARPDSSHHAAWVARSPLIGLDDDQLQEFIGGSSKGEDMLARLRDFAVNHRQSKMVSRWGRLSMMSRLVEALEETLDRSDLLMAYPDQTSRQDAEQFIQLVSTLARDLGGDSKVIADSVRRLREGDKNSTEAVNIPDSDAVRVMTIHGSKGLESKVVILADVFSGRQTNIRIESSERLIVTPDLFGGHPKPWPSKDPVSALWKHVKKAHLARRNAEARRLLYVAATRAENKLIICGSPKKTSWEDGKGITFSWSYGRSVPQLGEMWLESLRQGSWKRGEKTSHWLSSEDSQSQTAPHVTNKGTREIDPLRALTSGMLGSKNLHGITIMHHPMCFDTINRVTRTVLTPLQKIERTDKASSDSANLPLPTAPIPRNDNANSVRIAPHNLTVFNECPRRYWLETRGGRSAKSTDYHSEWRENQKFPSGLDAATLGKVIHRIFEIGLMNPGPPAKSIPNLPSSWTSRSPDRLTDDSLVNEVFQEILPPEVDKDECFKIVSTILDRIRGGPLGELCSGAPVNGHVVDGLRTEMPFHIARNVNMDEVIRGRWTPDGLEPLSSISQASLEMDGVIDLVLCTSTGDGSFIRPIDLKTEEAMSIFDDEYDGLISTMGNESFNPLSNAEREILEHHSMQLTLYYLSLKSIEDERRSRGLPNREVLRPAILVGVTGRIVEYPEDMFSEALKKIDITMNTVTEMALSSEAPISRYPCTCSTCN